jgi:hypothetical protein
MWEHLQQPEVIRMERQQQHQQGGCQLDGVLSLLLLLLLLQLQLILVMGCT